MSNVNSTYIDFDIIDYKNSSVSLSSYNTSLTPFKFSPIIPSEFGENVRVLWDFGDTAASTEYSPLYSYKLPGKYTVKLFVYNKYNQATRADIEKTVTVLDFVEDNFITTTSSLNLSCGILSNEIKIYQSLPYYYTDSTINYSVSGSNTQNYFNLLTNKYNHLSRYNSLFTKKYIQSTNSYELVEVDSISLPLSTLYAKLVNNTLTLQLTGDSTSIVVGASGVGSVYYRDDLPDNRFNLIFSRQYGKDINPLNITLSGLVVENKDSSKLSITSNGVDGDSEPLSSFNISPIKFNNSKIHFVVKLKDRNNNTIKNVNPFVLNGTSTNSIKIRLIGTNTISTSSYSISSLQSTLTALTGGGYFRGYIEYTDALTYPLTGVSLSASATNIQTVSGTNLPSVSGSSTSFSIYPPNYFKVYKKGEDIDGEAIYKSLRFQESLLDKEIFFGDFLGSIFGNADSDNEALSKKVNERILNFVDNNANIDTAEISKLLSMSQMLDSDNTIFDQNLSNFPNKIQRLISLLSVKKSKLFGVQNKFVENFNSLGFLNKETYGKNLGEKVDPYTFLVTPGVDIVAYEKYSRKYTLLNTYQPLLGVFETASIDTELGDEILTETDITLLTESNYLIIDYNDTWGWPLILPTNFVADDIPKYYDFYTFNNTFANNYVGGVLDMNITNIQDDEYYDAVILNTLYQSLSLTTN